MVYLVHGENYSYSRKIISSQQKKLGVETKTEVDLEDVTPEQLKALCTYFDIFGTPPFIVFNISKAGRQNLEPYTKIITDVPQETTLIILSSKDLSSTNIFVKEAKNLGINVVRNQKIPESNIFRFIDALYKGNRFLTYKELSKLIKEDQDPFYIFSMILYGARKNASSIGEEKTKQLFLDLYNTDKILKTGGIDPEIAIPYTVEKVFGYV